IGMRHISLSTCGIVQGILKLARENMQVTLCLSLHSALDNKRKQIMPTANAYSVKEIIDAAKIYFKNTGRRIIIEYTLISGFNDSGSDIDALVSVTKALSCHINVIPLNQVSGDLTEPSQKQAYAFAAQLTSRGRSATVRRSLGSDIEGACGQLKFKREGQ
ncbi:MAG: 23S rRNA (adenine(2503)-C(2))-methyltransferase RlmN, partial [Clostridia bacterium]|nr:23S rRNA (adenine(2503)-C(2))-methyltransferase RlmN [Clostridia bacterium]